MTTSHYSRPIPPLGAGADLSVLTRQLLAALQLVCRVLQRRE